MTMTMTMVTVDVFYETSPGCLLLPEAHRGPIGHALTECLLLPLHMDGHRHMLHHLLRLDLRHFNHLLHHLLYHFGHMLHHLLRLDLWHLHNFFPPSESQAQVPPASLLGYGTPAPPRLFQPSEFEPLAHASPLPASEPAELLRPCRQSGCAPQAPAQVRPWSSC